MPNPKRRHSRARTARRRAHDALPQPAASRCSQCQEYRLPHRICAHCGYYKGREVIEPKKST